MNVKPRRAAPSGSRLRSRRGARLVLGAQEAGEGGTRIRGGVDGLTVEEMTTPLRETDAHDASDQRQRRGPGLEGDLEGKFRAARDSLGADERDPASRQVD